MSSSLPGILGSISDIVGVKIALQIAVARGGTRVNIPPRAKPDHWLTDLVGSETADLICRGLATYDADGHLNGVEDVIPRGPTSMLATARRRARKALDDGASAREAARIAGLHERTIWRIKARGDDDQGELF